MIYAIDSITWPAGIKWATDYMNSSEKRFVYMVNSLEECDSIQDACPDKCFSLPEYMPSKQIGFKEMVKRGDNIIITHELLKRLRFTEQEAADMRQIGYELIMDRPLETLHLTYYMHIHEFVEIKNAGELIQGGRHAYWKIPTGFLSAFENVYIIAYNFQLSHLANDLKIDNIPYEICHIEDCSLKTGPQDVSEYKQWFKENVDLYHGKVNRIGDDEQALSSTKFKVMPTEQKAELMNSVSKYFRKVGAQGIRCMYARYKLRGEKYSIKDPLPVHRYHKAALVPFNTQATNKFHDRDVLCYAVNVYEHPDFVTYYNGVGIKTDQRSIALNSMLRWINLSAVGLNEYRAEPIHLAIFSSRMRNYLTDWLDS